MRIESFQFRDRATDWELEETKFDAFNLLVGVSGVGKTKIIDSLRYIADVARGAASLFGATHATDDAAWSIHFIHEGIDYTWTVSIEPVPDAGDMKGDGNGPNGSIVFSSEVLTRDGQEIIARTRQSFAFQGAALPKLRRSESALYLLAGEPSIALARDGILSLVFSEDNFGLKNYGYGVIESAEQAHRTEGSIRADAGLDVQLKAYLTQQVFPQSWGEITNLFRAIFPAVTELTTFRFHGPAPARIGSVAVDAEMITLGLRESTTKNWILGRAISSGMRHTLAHLINIHLARTGTVILIDDLENSLGNNCMPALVDFILGRAPDLQFIITSHHPYVINNLPVSTWRLVQRRGSHVRVLDARTIPDLQRASRLDAFFRLLNLPEFEDGIA